MLLGLLASLPQPEPACKGGQTPGSHLPEAGQLPLPPHPQLVQGQAGLAGEDPGLGGARLHRRGWRGGLTLCVLGEKEARLRLGRVCLGPSLEPDQLSKPGPAGSALPGRDWPGPAGARSPRTGPDSTPPSVPEAENGPQETPSGGISEDPALLVLGASCPGRLFSVHSSRCGEFLAGQPEQDPEERAREGTQ